MNMNPMDRVPPHNVEAEQSALGSMLLDDPMCRKLLDFLTPEDFYIVAHRRLFTLMIELSERGHPGGDFVLLFDLMRMRGEEEAVGGMSYITRLMDQMPTAANGIYYARIVREKAIARKMKELAYDAMEAVYTENLFDAAARIGGELLAIRPPDTTPEADALDQLEAIYDEACERKKSIDVRGFSSGWPQLDRLTGGFTPGFYILAGWTSIGKTAGACSIVQHVCRSHRVLFKSLEMEVGKLHVRMLSQMSGVPAGIIRQGIVPEDRKAAFAHAFTTMRDALHEGRLTVDFCPDLTLGKLVQDVREAKKAGLDLVVVDYAGLLQVPGIKLDQTRARNEAIANGIKALAGQEKVAILLLNQLKRPDKENRGKTPFMEDLAESAAYERNMDVGMFLFRKDYQADGEVPDDEDQDVQLLLRKNRDGKAGVTLNLRFRPETTLIHDPHAAWRDP